MKNKKNLLALLLVLVLCVGLLAGCGGTGTPDESPADESPAAESPSPEPKESDEPESDLAYIEGKGKIIVGITNFAPMDYPDDAGEWIGFDADMAREVAEALGVEVEFIEIDWDNKILELDAKSIDCVWNGMTLTDEVKNGMGTSKPYCNNAQVVVLSADVAEEYKTAESLAGLKFAVEAGSAGEAAAKDNGLEHTAVLTQADALMEVAAGAADACIIDLLMAGAMIGEGTSYPNLTHTVELTTEEYGIGFRKGSDMVDKVNEILKELYDSGRMQEIAAVYGVQEAILPQ